MALTQCDSGREVIENDELSHACTAYATHSITIRGFLLRLCPDHFKFAVQTLRGLSFPVIDRKSSRG